MRILMLFTIGFSASCAIGAYLDAYLMAAGIAFLLSVPLLLLRKKLAKATAVVLIGFAVGTVWVVGFHHFYLDSAKEYDGDVHNTTITVSDYSYQTDTGVAADGEIRLDGKKFTIRFYLNEEQDLKPGDKITGDIRLRLTTKDSLKGQTYHQGDGIFLIGYVQRGAQVALADNVPNRYMASKIRHTVRNVLQETFPEDTLGFVTALFLGDSSLLDYETDTNFKTSGIRHIIAVSGLHVSILISIVFMLCGRNRYLSAIIGIPLLVLFSAVVGFTPSVIRACMMQGLVLIGMFLNQEYDPPTSLAFAVLVMLLINPLTVVSVSFQLSVCCIIGIFLLFERINKYLLRLIRAPKGKSLRARLSRWFAGSVAISVSTFVTTTPLSAMYFGSVSIVGILTNLLTLWVVSFIFCGIILVILSGLIWPGVGAVIAWVISFPCRYVVGVAGLMGDLPFSAVYTESIYIMLWLIGCYFLLAVLILFKKKYPLTMVSCTVVLLILAIGASWLEPRLDRYRITIFDVGQGQSILVQYQGHSYLIDCGGDTPNSSADTVSQYLLSTGVKHLNGIFVTHYDKDHAGGIPNLLTSISADTLYLPDIEDETGLKELIAACGDNIQWITGVQTTETADGEFTMVAGEHASDDNERCMCVLFKIDEYDILITGDRSSAGEKELLKKIDISELDTLVVGHHGANSSTGMELLEVTRPINAVISVGENNYYGHPSESVLYRLRLFGCNIFRTDLDGTIVIRG